MFIGAGIRIQQLSRTKKQKKLLILLYITLTTCRAYCLQLMYYQLFVHKYFDCQDFVSLNIS